MTEKNFTSKTLPVELLNESLEREPIDDAWVAPAGLECPNCGENRMRVLVWYEEVDEAHCLRCDTDYSPHERRKEAAKK